jgi:hypothetical protein
MVRGKGRNAKKQYAISETPGMQCCFTITYSPPLDLHGLHTRHGHVRKCTNSRLTKEAAAICTIWQCDESSAVHGAAIER